MKHVASTLTLVALSLLAVSCEYEPLASATAIVSAPTPAREQISPGKPSAFPNMPVPNNAPAVIDQDDQAIYSLFMEDAGGAIVVIREDTFVDTYPQSEEEAEQFIRANLPGVSGQTLDSYLHVNSTPRRLPPDMALGKTYTLVGTPEFLEITSNPDWQGIWRQRFPDSEVGCIAFSRIGFDEAHTQALLYVARLWVDGGYFLLEHNAQNGAWGIVERFSNVIVD